MEVPATLTHNHPHQHRHRETRQPQANVHLMLTLTMARHSHTYATPFVLALAAVQPPVRPISTLVALSGFVSPNAATDAAPCSH